MLPAALSTGIAQLLEGVSRRELAQHAATLSQHYRRGGNSTDRVVDNADVAAYLATRLPATFAACAAAFAEAMLRAPAFAPKNLLDVGAGPGTASWAAIAAWPVLERVVMLDRNIRFREIARELVGCSGHAGLTRTEYLLEDLSSRALSLPPSDLVVASYALAELDAGRLSAVVAALWAACQGMLVLIEPGTPAGFARIVAARAQLLGVGAVMVAPCPHALSCPIVAPDWCHFAKRLPRSRDHMRTKSATVPFEDEKFSYLAVTRDSAAVEPIAARILAPVAASKAGLKLKLCTSRGIVAETIPRRARDDFARVRRLGWGDAISEN